MIVVDVVVSLLQGREDREGWSRCEREGDVNEHMHAQKLLHAVDDWSARRIDGCVGLTQVVRKYLCKNFHLIPDEEYR